MTTRFAVILGCALVIAAAIASGRFTQVAVPNGSGVGFVVILDRFTGATRACFSSGCRDLGELH